MSSGSLFYSLFTSFHFFDDYLLSRSKQERRNKICGGAQRKGATSIQKPGATPQACTNIKPSALKARFTFGAGSLNGYLELNRAFSPAFGSIESLGVAPG